MRGNGPWKRTCNKKGEGRKREARKKDKRHEKEEVKGGKRND